MSVVKDKADFGHCGAVAVRPVNGGSLENTNMKNMSSKYDSSARPVAGLRWSRASSPILMIALLYFGVWTNSTAGFIGLGSFSGATVVEDFNSFSGFNLATPLLIGGNTYNTSTNTMNFGTACTTTCFQERVGTGYIDVTLGMPVLRVGGDVGAVVVNGAANSFTAAFYGLGDVLLGSQNFSPIGLTFVGFQADAGAITRVRFTDISDDGLTLLLDNFRTDAQVPAPASIALMAIGLIGISYKRLNGKRRTLLA